MKLYSFFYTILGPIKKVFTAWYDSEETVILLFESEKDALIYASRLENQNFPSPTVVQFSRLDIEQFIIANNYLRLFVESEVGLMYNRQEVACPQTTFIDRKISTQLTAEAATPPCDGASILSKRLTLRDRLPTE